MNAVTGRFVEVGASTGMNSLIPDTTANTDA